MRTALSIGALAAAGSLSCGAAAQSYDVESFLPPPGDITSGSYEALCNKARLVGAFDLDFNTLGVITTGEDNAVAGTFQIAPPNYTWYQGLSNKGATVGFFEAAGEGPSYKGWIRDKFGNERIFTKPDMDVFLYGIDDEDVAVGEVFDPVQGHFSPAIADDEGLHVVVVPGTNPLGSWFEDNNNRGMFVGGTSDAVTGERSAFVWNSRTRDQPTPITAEEASEIRALSINNRGQVAGYYFGLEVDPDIGEFRPYSFIREPDGAFRTVEIDVSEMFPPDLLGDPESWGGYPVIDVIVEPLGTAASILDMNDRGELIVQGTGWYRWTLVFDLGLPPTEIQTPVFTSLFARPVRDPK